MPEGQTNSKANIVSTEAIDYHGVPATRVTYAKTASAGIERASWNIIEVYVDGCAYCDKEKAVGSTFFPNHFASERCESGKRKHCSCDGCF
jgi:hypothetical protein